MQAIILAAGMGKRLGELTKANTKCMIKVHNETLIERMLNQLVTLPNLKRVVLVIGYEGEKVKELIGSEFAGVPISYVYNPVYFKTNNIYSLYLAKDLLLEDDTVLLESDLIFEQQILKKLVETPYPNLAVVAKYESWMDGTVVSIDEEHNILSFVPKKAFRFRDISTYYKTVNIYKFSKEFSASHYVPFLEAYSKALGNNEYYEQVLRVITLLERPNIKAMPLDNEKWYEIDDIQDLNNAETIFSPVEDKLASYQNRYGGYWRFPEILDFCYLVNPFFPPAKLMQEIKAYFFTLLTQYPSGAKVNRMLAAKYFGIRPEYTLIGNGAAELINAYLSDCKLRTGIIYPTFEEYPNRLAKDLIVPYYPSKEGFSYTVDDLINYFEDKNIEQLLLINPDNPSGNYLKINEIERILSWAASVNIRVIYDESFIDFSEQPATLLSNDALEANPNLLVVKSISKSYGVPGLRLGILASSNPAILQSIQQKLSIWNINSFAEFYLQIFGKYEGLYQEACQLFIQERNRFYDALQTISFLKTYPSAANYFLCKINNGKLSHELAEELLFNHKILIKDCSTKEGFSGESYIRIAVRDESDNNKLVAALKELEPSK